MHNSVERNKKATLERSPWSPHLAYLLMWRWCLHCPVRTNNERGKRGRRAEREAVLFIYCGSFQVNSNTEDEERINWWNEEEKSFNKMLTRVFQTDISLVFMYLYIVAILSVIWDILGLKYCREDGTNRTENIYIQPMKTFLNLIGCFMPD